MYRFNSNELSKRRKYIRKKCAKYYTLKIYGTIAHSRTNVLLFYRKYPATFSLSPA